MLLHKVKYQSHIYESLSTVKVSVGHLVAKLHVAEPGLRHFSL